MHEIDTHSIQVLEYPKVRAIIASFTLSPYGRRRVETMRPIFDRDEIETRLRRSAQMREIIRFEEAMPLDKSDDISELIDKARIEGVHLEPKQLLQVRSFLEIAAALHRYGKQDDRAEKFPDICEILSRFHPKRDIAATIGKAIDSDGSVTDNASRNLTRIRRELIAAEAHIKQHLDKILGSRRKHAGWQDDVITIRDGRFVIPVLSGDFQTSQGIVHDKSHSGATLFVEPSSAIPLNNKLRQLQQDERVEIDRILRELTALVGDAADDIKTDLNSYGLLDDVHARATFAIKIKAAPPAVSDSCKIDLIDARHPLLVYAAESNENIVPLDISLDRDTQGILVTGPNTGGKTVALKTIGLLTLMVMSGLEISADHKSTIGIYQQVFADIGDEQSIELSLSTFSSHVRNIIVAVNEADQKSLVLLDEIGAGTDPKEGAALAEVIILTLLEQGCNLIATTHYSQLKTLPLEIPSLVNASLEFDRQNLQPTFRLRIGHPGSSYAIDIAHRLGLPSEMAKKASQLLGSDERSLDNLIARLDEDLKTLNQRNRELEDRLAGAGRLEEFYRAQKEQLATKERELTKQFTEKFQQQLENGKEAINRLIKEIRETQAASRKIKESQQKLAGFEKEIADRKKVITPKRESDGRLLKKGDLVWIEKFKTEGEVIEMVGKKKARVAIGSASMVVDTIELERREQEPKGPKGGRRDAKVEATAAQGDFHPEIMLRGLTVEEALERLDKFLDDAVVAGIGQVYVVHGKGTGTLRRHLTTYLKNHKAIKSIRVGDWNEGGHGVTIARLKE